MLTSEMADLIQRAPVANRKLTVFPDCDHLELPIKATQKFGEVMEEFLASCE
jgi:hypothetical protein